MRVVAGEYRGRQLKGVPGMNTRPTTDKVKESLFNIIGPYFNGGVMLDMYAGSGGIAIEAVSRGMEYAVLCEKNRQAIQTIETNIQLTKQTEKFQVLRGDVKQRLKTIQDTTFDLVFLDPPYAHQEIEKDLFLLQELNLLTATAVVVCELEAKISLPEEIGSLVCKKRVEYGITALVIFEMRK